MKNALSTWNVNFRFVRQVHGVVWMFMILLAISDNLSAHESQKTDKGNSFAIRDGRMFESKACFPKFTRVTARMYYHFGEITRVLNSEEVKFIADVTSKENLLKVWEDMVQVAKTGKISIYRFCAKGKGQTDITIGEMNTDGMIERSKMLLDYSQACYLIGEQPYTYFQNNWGRIYPAVTSLRIQNCRNLLEHPKQPSSVDGYLPVNLSMLVYG